MEGGICIAGVDEKRKWFRPIRLPGYKLNFPDMRDRKGQLVIDNYNEIEFTINQFSSNNPHSEDAEVDWAIGPKLIRRLDDGQIKELLVDIDESEKISRDDDIGDYLLSNSRSLILVKPQGIPTAISETSFGKLRTRIIFQFMNRPYDYTCTDLYWRDLPTQKSHEIFSKSNLIYLSIGLTRRFRGKYWPMVIGVHTLPRYEVKKW